MKPNQFSPVSKSTENEFYNIPLFGEVRFDRSYFSAGHDIGEIISNFRQQNTHTITVKTIDNGLAGEGIFSGDLLTVRIGQNINNGDIAVVRLGHKIYIRKIYFDKKRVRLETADHTPSPLIVDRHTPGFEILGKVTTVFREL